jgi:hypothetical protein
MPTKAKSASKPKVYSDILATCIRQSKMIDSLGKTITKFVSGDTILTVWSFEDSPHTVSIGQQCLLRVVHMPDGKVFYNLE